MVRVSVRREILPTRGATVALLVLGSVLAAPPALAQSDTADELARRHFESGVAYLEESDYDNALRAFQKAYDLSRRPEILLNIATVQERRADIEGAITALNAYLEAAPNGEHAETVKLRIQNLEKRRPAPVEPPKPSEPAPIAAPAPVTAPPPAPAPVAAHPSRVPAFVTLGVGAAAGIGALVTGLVAKSKYDDLKASCSPNCTDSQISGSRTLAVTSTVLTGVALVGVGVGVTLLVLSKPNDPTATSQRLELAVAPSIGGGSAHAAWRF